MGSEMCIRDSSLAMEVDLEGEFHKKMDRVMTRKARTGKLGIRVTEYSDD